MYNHLHFKKVIGVEALLLNEGNIHFHLVELTLKNHLLSVGKTGLALENIEQLKEHLVPGIPISLMVNGKGVLTKTIPEAQILSEEQLLYLVLPNVKVSDFYIQPYRQGTSCFTSIIRKSSLDIILNSFIAQGIPVVSVGIGPAGISTILPLVSLSSDIFSFGRHQFQVKDGQLQAYLPKEAEENELVLLGGESIESVLLLAYAAAFQLLSPAFGNVSLPIQQVVTQKLELHQQKIFSLLGWTLLGFFFGILLINYFVFDFYSKENAVLTSKEVHHRGLLTELDTLEKKVREKERFLTSTGWLSSISSAYMADQLAASLPSSIQLTELTINPVNEKETKQTKQIAFEPGLIKLGGTCSQPTQLNPWLQIIQQFGWVRNAQMQNYSFDTKNQTGHFSILIYLK